MTSTTLGGEYSFVNNKIKTITFDDDQSGLFAALVGRVTETALGAFPAAPDGIVVLGRP